MSPRDPDKTRTFQIPRAVAQTGGPAATGCLTVIRGQGHDLGKNLLVDDAVVIGRSKDCELVVEDFGASRRHCRIFREQPDCYVLEDLRSTNGTLVNGTPVESRWELRNGEKIFIGETVVRFTLYDDIDLKFSSEVRHLLGTDPLTGLESKRSFDHALDYAVAQALRAERLLAILMMDLDGIKQINDAHGHLFGAYTIQQAGRLIAEVVGGAGRACRFGGDEFTVFLPGMDKSEACRVAERIRSGLENAGLEKDSIPLRPTVSIGVAELPEDGGDVLSLITVADRALYRAKAEGKNRVCRG